MTLAELKELVAQIEESQKYGSDKMDDARVAIMVETDFGSEARLLLDVSYDPEKKQLNFHPASKPCPNCKGQVKFKSGPCEGDWDYCDCEDYVKE